MKQGSIPVYETGFLKNTGFTYGYQTPLFPALTQRELVLYPNEKESMRVEKG